jgi:hypothetical protein
MNNVAGARTRQLDFLPLDLELSVPQRLSQLQSWTAIWQAEDEQLQQRVMNLNPARQYEVLLGSQIASLRRRLAFQVAQIPIYLNPEAVHQVGIATLRQHLVGQYANLSTAERYLWLTNLFFLLTPTLRTLIEKLEKIRHYRRLGQQRCFLLGGVSGMGKSSLLNWYAFNYLPIIQSQCNFVPVVRIDAPVNNRSPRPLFERILLACGATALSGDDEHYLHLLALYFQQCRVELLIIDEVEHIIQPVLRRRVLELSNLTGVPIVCASCNPIAWTAGDEEIQGRWNDHFELTQFTGLRLDAFLTLLELLLPFTQDGQLGCREMQDGQGMVAGPAHYIEQWTDGIVREVMALVMDACDKALTSQAPGLTLAILEQAWRDVKRAKVVNFLDLWRARQGGGHG